jgi:hypothetical protein
MSDTTTAPTKIGRAISPHDAVGGDLAKATFEGPIVTPDPVHEVDLATASAEEIEAHLQSILLYRQLGGRPAIRIYSPAAGHTVLLYTDGPGGSDEHRGGRSA